MIIDEDIKEKLKEYGEAFDFYMDNGKMPDYIPPDDPLGQYMVKVFEDNPQLDSQNQLWVEILKDDMMKFIAAMLQLFIPIEKDYKQEIQYMSYFASENLEYKRLFWSNVYNMIKKKYTKLEVNIDGYVEQMKGNNPLPILSMLTKDWRKACDEKLLLDKQEIIDKHIQKWESHLVRYGEEDYKQRKKVEKIFYSYPQLAEILQLIGREQPSRKEEFDDTVTHYMPILPSPPRPAAEVEEIAQGNNLQYLLPIETALMADKYTEDLFLLKYATHQLQLFANKPKEQSDIKREQHEKNKPRLDKGPIIVSLDTSGSMDGRPLQIATSVLLQLLRMAKKQKRKCFLIEFSVQAQCLDLSDPCTWSQLDDFLDNHFSGGTDGEEMLDAALNALQTNDYSMADVLIISDFEFSQPNMGTCYRMNVEHNKGTRFYGLQIGGYHNEYYTLLDEIWKT